MVELPEANHYSKFEHNPKYPRASARYRDIQYLDNQSLLEPHINKYFYNACICDAENGYRLFYRAGKEPKGYEDRLATCLLDSKFNVVSGSNKYLEVHSNWSESAITFVLKKFIPYVFKNGTHVEDPRVVLFNNHWFVFYTDGINMLVAKITLDCTKTIYSHYIFPPPETKKHSETDGREKNWTPFVSNSNLYVLYSEKPRTIFKYVDTGGKLEVVALYGLNIGPYWDYGNIRGGAPPVEYDNDNLIWFFHCQTIMPSHLGDKRVYMIGAYLTSNKFPFKYKRIVHSPILVGIPSEISETRSLQDCVVFPCGAVKTQTGWRVSMGVNDYEIGFIDITERNLFWNYSTEARFYEIFSRR